MLAGLALVSLLASPAAATPTSDGQGDGATFALTVGGFGALSLADTPDVSPQRLGAELGVWSCGRSLQLGADLGVSRQRLYTELQAAISRRLSHDSWYMVGISAGPSYERSAQPQRWGGQLTGWGTLVGEGWPIPLFPFARVELLPGRGVAASLGLMFKLGWVFGVL